jgi:hypothetical protein
MLIQRDHTWHPWHRPIVQIFAPADYCKGTPMTDVSSHTPHEPSQPEIGRFLRGIGQWGGLYLYYTDPRVRLVERLEAQGHVAADRSDSAYMVVTLTEQAAGYASFYEAHDAIEQEKERLMAQLETALNGTPRIVYPALQAAAREMDEVLHEEGTNEEMLRDAASHLLKALYDTRLISKPTEGQS